MPETTDELVVIFWSDDDQEFIAHSLNHDEFGTGETALLALADCIRAVGQIKRLALEDGRIQLLRKAPPELWERARAAEPLPAEAIKVATWMANDHWPELMTFPDLREDAGKTFVGALHESSI